MISKVNSVFGQLHSLKSLDLSNNRITSTPLPLGLLAETLKALRLDGNPLPEDVSALAQQGAKPFLAHMQGILKEELRLRRANVMIVGGEKSGKTALYHGLLAKWEEVRSLSLRF